MRVSSLFAGLALAAVFGTTALGAPAMAAPPSDPMAVFQTVCLQHEADLKGAEAAALGLGLPILTDKRGQTLSGTEMELVLRSNDEKITVLVSPAPAGLIVAPGGKMMFCAVIALDDDGALFPVGKALAARMQLPAPGNDDDKVYMVFYRKTPTGLVGLPDDKAAVGEATLAGEYRIFDVRTGEGSTMFSLASAWK